LHHIECNLFKHATYVLSHYGKLFQTFNRFGEALDQWRCSSEIINLSKKYLPVFIVTACVLGVCQLVKMF